MRHSLTSLIKKCTYGTQSQNNTTNNYTFFLEQQCEKYEMRHIPTTPYRILDAPGVINDYYLNNLDWVENRITISLKDTVYSYNVDTKEVNEIFANKNGYICSVKADHNNIFIGDSQGVLRVYDLEKNELISEIHIHHTRVSSLSINGNILTSGEKEGHILNSDLRYFKVSSIFEGHTQEVCGLKWSPTKEYLASGSNDNTIRIWKLGYPTSIILKGHNSAIKAMDWCKWKSNILCSGGGSKDKTIRMWDVLDTKEIKKIETDSQVCTLTYLTKYKEIITSHGFQQNDLKLWKASGGIKLIKSFGSHDSRVLHTAISPDETSIASLGADESLKFWIIGEEKNQKLKKNSLSIR